MRELTEQETARILPIVIEEGKDLKAGDKCPREDCRGILIEEPLLLFNSKHPEKPLAAFKGLVCDMTNKSKRAKSHCDFQYLPKGVSDEIEKWRAEVPEAEEAQP